MKIDVKPLVHWAIYKSYTLRYRTRSPAQVTGVLTGADGGETAFEYLPEGRVLQMGGECIRLNEYGWEVEHWTAS